jgi:hypothetical protein
MNHVCIAVLMKFICGMSCGGKINPHCHLRRLFKIFAFIIEWWGMRRNQRQQMALNAFLLYLNKLQFLKSTKFWLLCSQNHSLSIPSYLFSTCCRWALIVYYVRHSALEAIFLIHLFMKYKQQRLIKLTTSKIHQSSKKFVFDVIFVFDQKKSSNNSFNFEKNYWQNEN